MNSETCQNRYNSEWGCNNLFPYTEVIDRHFKILDEMEKLIPRYHPVLWKGDPKDLDSFLIHEQEARELRSGAVDRLYRELIAEEEPSFDQDVFSDIQIDESFIELDDISNVEEIKIQETEPKEEDDEPANLERYFSNASPIPHLFTNLNEGNCMGEDYLNGIPLIVSSPESKDENIILKRKEAYKKKKLENKLNNAFISPDNFHSRDFYNSKLKTDHPIFNLGNILDNFPKRRVHA